MAAKDDQELSLFHLATTKLSDAQKLTDEAHDLLKQDLENVRQEKSDFEQMTKTLTEVHFGSSVKLNVGGKIYKTTLDTLRKDPDSMLCAMFSGRHELKPDEEDGAYFIDRDGKLFRYILNYLRHGELICPNDRAIQKDLLKEAQFYQVQELVAQLQEEMYPSVILNTINHSAILSWLPPGANTSLLYRSSTAGRSPEDFHRCCDEKGPNLVVIKSGEYIFGGYTSKSWLSPASLTPIEDSESFLFTLVNPSGSKPIKINQKPGEHAGTQCLKSSGPAFGNKSYYDLQVWSKSESKLDLGYGFTCPENADKNKLFTGKNPLEITELEVFKVDF